MKNGSFTVSSFWFFSENCNADIFTRPLLRRFYFSAKPKGLAPVFFYINDELLSDEDVGENLFLTGKKLNVKSTIIDKCKIILLSALLLPTLCLANYTQTQSRRQVLILNSRHQGSPSVDKIIKAIQEEFEKTDTNIELNIEYMDINRHRYNEIKPFLEELYAAKYKNVRFDAIITTSRTALMFLLANSGISIAETPIVFCGFNKYIVPNLVDSRVESDELITGIYRTPCSAKTIEIAFKLHLSARQLVLVTHQESMGGLDLVRNIIQNSKTINRPIEAVNYYSYGLTPEQFLKKIEALGGESILLFYDAMRDSHSFENSFKIVRQSCTAPIYTVNPDLIEQGAVGGCINDFSYQGKKVAEIIIRILNGQKPNNIPIINEDIQQYVFDYVQLKQFGISVSDLPKGSIVINRPFAFYYKNKVFVWSTIAIIYGLGMVVVMLCVNIIRRVQAEDQLKKHHDHLEELIADRAEQIIKINEELKQEISERKQAEQLVRKSEERLRSLVETTSDWIWEVDQNGLYTYASPRVKDLLGYEPAEILGKTPFDLMPEAEVEKTSEFFKEKVSNAEPFYQLENINLHKDGHLVVLETSGVPIFDERGQLKGYRGIDRDITGRKNRETRRVLAAKILESVNREGTIPDVIRNVVTLIKHFADFEAVGIRFRDGDDFPYFEAKGFSNDFIEAENYLCARDEKGRIVRDSDGKPLLECMCGTVLSGRTDPTMPFFTEAGSFWTNSTTKLLASTSPKERQSQTKNRCNTAGFESVAHIPLRSSNQIVGLLQLNDTRLGCFTLEMIQFFERIAVSIGIALARIEAEENAEDLAKFPSENPFPVLRITGNGNILYANDSANSLLNHWNKTIGDAVPENWCSLITEALEADSNKVTELDYQDRIFSFVIAPVTSSDYVNIYGHDVTKHRKAERQIQKFNQELEQRVAQRTAELDNSNKLLKQEIAEREQVEQALRTNEAKFRHIYESSPVMMYSVDDQGIICDVNKKWLQEMGYSRQGVIGKKADFFLTHESANRALSSSILQFWHDGSIHDVPYQYVKKDSTVIDVLVDCIATTDPAGNWIVLSVVRNVTERKKLERKLLEIIKEEQHKIGQELHDNLGQQLTGISFMTKVLHQQLVSKTAPEAKDAGQITALVNETISHARALAKGLYPVELNTDGLMSALQELVVSTETLYTISCAFDCKKPVLIKNNILATHLYRIAQEAVNNAVKHGKADRVSISLGTNNGFGVLTVKSNGLDFPKVLPKSDGMGLQIMKYRASVIDGSVDIRRGRLGGTVLTCSFPNKVNKE